MKGVSHVIIGVAGVALFQRETGFVQPHLINGLDVGLIMVGMAAVAGSLLPDIDHPNATLRGWLGLASHQTAWEVALKLGRRVGGRILDWLIALLAWLPVAVYRLILKTSLDVTLDHRGITHTLWAIAGVFALAYLAPWRDAGLAFALAYALHIVADMLTRAGVALLWPVSRYAFGLLPKFLRITTGSLPEWAGVFGVVAFVAWRWGLIE